MVKVLNVLSYTFCLNIVSVKIMLFNFYIVEFSYFLLLTSD